MDLLTRLEQSVASATAVTQSVQLEILEWYDAKAKLPPGGVRVICWGRGGYFIAYWDFVLTMGWINEQTSEPVFGVTHWAMPLGPRSCAAPGWQSERQTNTSRKV